MALSIRPIQPEFAGEVSGVDITQPLSREDVAAIEAGMDRYAVLVFHDQHLTDDAQRAFTPQFRHAGGVARRAYRHTGRAPAAARHAGCVQSRQGPEAAGARRPAAHVQPRQPAVAFRQLVSRGAGEVFAAVRAYRGGPRRSHRVRRHARRLRRAGRRDQGGDRGPGLRTFADVLARRARLHRADRARSGRCSGRCASAWCARIR